jgi:hypothetical protein
MRLPAARAWTSDKHHFLRFGPTLCLSVPLQACEDPTCCIRIYRSNVFLESCIMPKT